LLLPPAFDCKGVVGPPGDADPLAALDLVGLRVVLPDDGHPAAALELDGVARDRSRVDDALDDARLAVPAEADALRPDREAAAVALEHVRDADEARDELVRR